MCVRRGVDITRFFLCESHKLATCRESRSCATAEKMLVSTAQFMYILLSLVALASRRKLHNKEAWLPAEIPLGTPFL